MSYYERFNVNHGLLLLSQNRRAFAHKCKLCLSRKPRACGWSSHAIESAALFEPVILILYLCVCILRGSGGSQLLSHPNLSLAAEPVNGVDRPGPQYNRVVFVCPAPYYVTGGILFDQRIGRVRFRAERRVGTVNMLRGLDLT